MLSDVISIAATLVVVTHPRLLIVDGSVAFTGGAGIADEWSGHAQSARRWRDTHVRVTGPG